MLPFDLTTTLQILPSIIIGLTVHEFAHAYVAHLCGDSTSKQMGRTSLNPLRHIDPVGFILIVIAGFGWAKPVELNKRNLRDPYSDSIKISLAGPVSNAILGFVFAFAYALLVTYVSEGWLAQYEFYVGMVFYGIFINWGLFVFNMLPIPPLDGSHVFLAAYEDRPWYPKFAAMGMGAIFLIFLIQWQTDLTILPIMPIVQLFAELSASLSGLILGFFQ